MKINTVEKVIISVFVFIVLQISCKNYNYCGKDFNYHAILKDSLNRTITEEDIRLELKKDTSWSHENQLAAVYYYDETLIQKDSTIDLGMICKEEGDTTSYKILPSAIDETGYLNNKEKYWIHPIRSNQYYLAQLAPFVDVKKNAKKGEKWTGGRNIGGYPFLEKSPEYYRFKDNGCELIGRTSEYYELKNKRHKINGIRCWWIHSYSDHLMGKTIHDFYFNKRKGLIYQEYQLVNGYKLTITLNL